MIETTTTLCSAPVALVRPFLGLGDEYLDLCTVHVDDAPCPVHGTTLEDVR